MRSITILLFVVFAAVSLASPLVEEEEVFHISELGHENIQHGFLTYPKLKELGLNDEEIDVYFLNIVNRLIRRLQDKIKELLERICKQNDKDVCKKWVDQNITRENIIRLWKEIRPLVKAHCQDKKDVLCAAARILLRFGPR